jgi:hypothetical protein
LNLSHIDPPESNAYRIPFLAWGAAVAEGADLYQLNRETRAHPGRDQIPFTEDWQPIRNGDAANLSLALLGLDPIAGSSINAHQDLLVNVPGTAVWNGRDTAAGQAAMGSTGPTCSTGLAPANRMCDPSPAMP